MEYLELPKTNHHWANCSGKHLLTLENASWCCPLFRHTKMKMYLKPQETSSIDSTIHQSNISYIIIFCLQDTLNVGNTIPSSRQNPFPPACHCEIQVLGYCLDVPPAKVTYITALMMKETLVKLHPTSERHRRPGVWHMHSHWTKWFPIY